MKRSYVIALVIAVAAAGWVASGELSLSETTAPEAASPPTGAVPSEPPQRAVPAVRVVRLAAEPMVQRLTLYGRTEAARKVELRTEIRGRVEEVLAKRGAPVAEGEVILRLAVEDRQHVLEQARAFLAQRRIEYEAARTLTERGFNPEIRLAEARANLDAAEVAVRQAELDLQRLTIRAPFAGILETRPAELGDYLEVGDVVGTVVDLDPVKVVGHVSERNVAALQLGARGQARLIGGEEVEGEITYIAATADPATRTYRVEMTVPNPERRIPEGMTAELIIPVTQQLAHQISPAVLTLADDGTVGVKLIGPDNRVRFAPVQILGPAPRGVWLDGLPGQADIIVVGQEYVTPEQVVAPSYVQPGDLS